MWTRELSSGLEAAKCRGRIISYLKGAGLDIGCGNEKIVSTAIGVGASGSAIDLHLDLSSNDSLAMFSDNFFDYVFSAHCLEDFYATEAVLRQWWRVIRPGGHLLIYTPDPDYYPRIGTDGCNPTHKRDLYWQDVWKILKGFGNAKKVNASRHNLSNEYSWLLCVRKTYGFYQGRCSDCPYKWNLFRQLWLSITNLFKA